MEVISILSTLAFFVTLIVAIVSAIKKNGKAKKWSIGILVSCIVFIVAAVNLPSSTDSSTPDAAVANGFELMGTIGILSFLGLLICPVMAIIAAIKKNGKAKKWSIGILVCFITFIVAIFNFNPSTDTSVPDITVAKSSHTEPATTSDIETSVTSTKVTSEEHVSDEDTTDITTENLKTAVKSDYSISGLTGVWCSTENETFVIWEDKTCLILNSSGGKEFYGSLEYLLNEAKKYSNPYGNVEEDIQNDSFKRYQAAPDRKAELKNEFVYDGANIRFNGEASQEKTGSHMKVYYLDTGTLYYSGGWKNRIFDGKGVKYYRSGIKLEEFTYKDGKLTGQAKVFYPSGSLHKIKNYKDGELTGQAKEFYPSGSLYTLANYKNGKLNGSYTAYYSDGKKGLEYQYKKGEKSGKFIEYYSNGNKQREGTWKNPLLDFDGVGMFGKGVEYFESGKVMYKGEFKRGRYDGDGTLYNEKGEVIYKGKFEDGKPKSSNK